MTDFQISIIWGRKNEDIQIVNINKIKDERLKIYLEEYYWNKDINLFKKILEYFGTYVEDYEIIITLFKIYKEGILIGISDRDGVAGLYVLRLHEDFYVLKIFKAYYRNIPEFWRGWGEVFHVEKKEGIYRCGCGFLSDDFKEFEKHFLGHEEIQNRHDQLKKEMEILKEEEERMNAENECQMT